MSEIYIRVRFFKCTFGTLGFALDFLNRGVVIYSLGLFSLHFFYVVLYFVLKITSVFFLGNVCVCVCVCVCAWVIVWLVITGRMREHDNRFKNGMSSVYLLRKCCES